jgi:hypothetical protein
MAAILHVCAAVLTIGGTCFYGWLDSKETRF